MGTRGRVRARGKPGAAGRAVRGVLYLAGAGLVLVAVLALRDARRVGADLARGGDLLEALSLSDLDTDGAVERRVRRATAHLREADERARASRWLSVAGAVPGVSRQVDALRDVAATAARLGTTGDEALGDLSARLNERAAGGERRVEILAALERRAADAAVELATLEVAHHTWLAPPLEAAQARLERGLTDAQALLHRTTDTLGALRTLVAGPSRLLVLAGSNAEMRGGMGMPLHAGIVDIEGGTITAGEFRATSDLLLAEEIPVPDDLDDLFGWLDPGAEWRNTASSANFPAIAPVYAELAERAGLGAVDGVLHVDVVAMSDLLGAVGPVTILNVPVRQDNTEELLLSAVYLQEGIDRQVRHDILGTVAREVFGALGDRAVPARELGVALVRAAEGRHLMAWSRARAIQDAWESVGAAGALDPRGLLIGVQNHGGYKLDWYLRPEAAVTSEVRGGRRRVQVDLDVRSTAPRGLPEGVAGSPLDDLPFGSYRAFVTFYLPEDATSISVGDREALIAGLDGPMKVVAVRFDVAPGSTQSARLEFEIPADQPLRLLPSARAHPIAVQVGDEPTSDAAAVRLW